MASVPHCLPHPPPHPLPPPRRPVSLLHIRRARPAYSLSFAPRLALVAEPDVRMEGECDADT